MYNSSSDLRQQVQEEEDDDDVQEVPIEPGNLTLTIKNGKIQPNKSLVKSTTTNQFDLKSSGEVTITNTTRSSNNSTTTNSAGGKIVLDDDVMVGYDVPMMDVPSPPASFIENPKYKAKQAALAKQQQQQQQQQFQQMQAAQKHHSERGRGRPPNSQSDMARALKSNPNISMRELFPGEEDMSLNINIPFGGPGTIRTPEGWYKTNTTIQYDDATKALWEELMRPYGNQSSFIRHLVLLEKYYRSGELVLSQNASSSAMTYSESMRNRLRSYDNIPSNSSHFPIPGGATPAFSTEITIIPASKMRKPPTETKMNAPATVTKTNITQESQKRKFSEQYKNLQQKEKIAKMEDGAKKMPPPPELIKFSKNTNPNVSKSANGQNQNKTSSPPPVIPSSITITPATSVSTFSSNSPPIQSTPSNNTSNSSPTPEVIVLSDQLSPQELKEKHWRPKLIPITSASTSVLNSKGPLYQAVDGRRLPALVQVMSGGKPYHITIHDYNRMCLIRREKLQMQMAQKRQVTSSPPSQTSTPIKNSTSQPPPLAPAGNQSQNSKNRLVNIPNQILEQNSLIPLGNSDGSKSNASKKQQNVNGNPANSSKKQDTNQKLPNSTSLMPLPPTTSTSLDILPSSVASFLSHSALSSLAKTVNSLSNNEYRPSTSISGGGSTNQPPLDALMKQAQAWMMSAAVDDPLTADAAQSLATLAQLTALKTNVGGGIVLDNSAASLLSKIPKSLTVIPQQKSSQNRQSEDIRNHSAS